MIFDETHLRDVIFDETHLLKSEKSGHSAVMAKKFQGNLLLI